MEFLTGKELASALKTSASKVTRMKQEGYIDYEPDTTKYDLAKASQAYAYWQEVKSGKLVNLSRVAEILETSKSNITQMTQANKLKVVEVGSKEVFYSLKEVEEFKQSRQKEEKSQQSEDKDEKELKIKTMQVDLAIKELALSEKRGQVMPIEIVQQQTKMLIHKIDEFMAIGAERIASSIRHCKDDDERRVKIDYELNLFVKDLKRFVQKQNEEMV